MNGDEEAGLEDVKRAAADPAAEKEILRLVEELRSAGYFDTAKEIEALLAQGLETNL
jgi:hypothetical protein